MNLRLKPRCPRFAPVRRASSPRASGQAERLDEPRRYMAAERPCWEASPPAAERRRRGAAAYGVAYLAFDEAKLGEN